MDTNLGDRIVGKIARRTVPLLGLIYLVSYLDRINVGFAALTMNRDLGVSPAVYGLAAGIFFFGYLLFQVPSNLLLLRFGARRWIAGIMVAWGTVSSAMSVVDGSGSLLAARFLLGIAEAGFFPGIILYLTTWFPPAYRARVVAAFMFAIPISTMLGAPVSGFILQGLDGALGLAGWRWLFLLEGLPAILGATAILAFLPETPERVSWLTDDERLWLRKSLHAEGRGTPALEFGAVVRTILDPAVLMFCLIYFGLTTGLFGIGLWLPLIVADSGVDPATTGLLTAIPYAFAAAGMLYWGRRGDRSGRRAPYVWWPSLVAAAAFAASATATSLGPRLAFLTIATVGIIAALPTFWAYVTAIVAPSGVAAAIAMINSTGNLGGLLGPVVVGWIKDRIQSFQLALIAVGAFAAGSAALAALLARARR